MPSWKYRIKPFIIRTIRAPKYFIQRGRRGWSDKDTWNADMYLAGIIAGLMQHLVNNGMGVSMYYSTKQDDDVDEMYERMKVDFEKHIEVFNRYSKYGYAHDEAWQKEFGGANAEELSESLEWFKEHFMDLWD